MKSMSAALTMTKMYACDVKRLAVRACTTKALTCRHTADLMDVSKSTVSRWVRQSHRPPVLRATRPGKVTQAVLDAIKSHLDTDPFLTAVDLAAAVWADCFVTVSKNTIPSCLRRIGYTRKKTYARAPPTEAMNAKRESYQAVVRTIDMHECISVDEAAFYLDAKPGHGYAPRGVRIGVPLTVETTRMFCPNPLDLSASLWFSGSTCKNTRFHAVCRPDSVFGSLRFAGLTCSGQVHDEGAPACRS